jgi:VIT1/CCC1 family predicted Fe2+/Mn2+ transporter
MEEHVKQEQSLAMRANTLRAGVLGANDGILTVVGVLFSVGAVTTDSFTLFIAGLADLLAVAFSMAGGEYASVSSQKDTEAAAVRTEERLLQSDFASERAAVVADYTSRGVSAETATQIADELLKTQALKTVVGVKYELNPDELMNPWMAALASLICAALGGILPLAALTFLPGIWRWIGTIIATIIAVGLTGLFSARLGHGFVQNAVVRNIIIGIITMIIHYGIGRLF